MTYAGNQVFGLVLNSGEGTLSIPLPDVVHSMEQMAFKIEVEDDTGIWSDVLAADGSVVTFASEDAARSGLAVRFPEAIGLEKFGGVKKTRVVRVFRTDEEWENG